MIAYQSDFIPCYKINRLAKDIRADPTQRYHHLLDLPKGLLPLAGVPLIDYWINDIKTSKFIVFNQVYIVTNQLFYTQFSSWALTRGIPSENVINDRTTSNETRIGASGDIALCLELATQRNNSKSSGVLVLAGDTLLYPGNFSLDQWLGNLPDKDTGGILYYQVKSENEVSKRGIVELDESTGLISKLLEKPKLSETSSRRACPAIYAYRKSSFSHIFDFVRKSKGLPLEEHDAPGKLLSYLISQSDSIRIFGHEIDGRFDIGSLDEYESTLHYFEDRMTRRLSSLPTEASNTCYARCGLIGNPSDGFGGKTISFLIKNFSAIVLVKSSDSRRVQIIPHPVYDTTSYSSLDSLQLQASTEV